MVNNIGKSDDDGYPSLEEVPHVLVCHDCIPTLYKLFRTS